MWRELSMEACSKNDLEVAFKQIYSLFWKQEFYGVWKTLNLVWSSQSETSFSIFHLLNDLMRLHYRLSILRKLNLKSNQILSSTFHCFNTQSIKNEFLYVSSSRCFEETFYIINGLKTELKIGFLVLHEMASREWRIQRHRQITTYRSRKRVNDIIVRTI